MSEKEKNSGDIAAIEVATVNLKKILGQHLQALAVAGIETVPRGTGQFSFLPSELGEESAVDVDSKGAEQASIEAYVSGQSGSEAVVVKESMTGSLTVEATTDKTKELKISSANGYGASLPRQERQRQLNVIQAEVAECKQCPELAANRTQTVFGVGEIAPRLVLVGEAPGGDEDRVGEPFVGAAGQLLNKILVASKLKRSEVYILNTVKCRPPANRNPSQTELDHCWGYAERQLEILQPEFICCLGSVAAKRLLNSTESLGRLRQKFHQYRGSRVIVTYHPAYLLRTESAKKHVWEDMKMLVKEMGIDLTK